MNSPVPYHRLRVHVRQPDTAVNLGRVMDRTQPNKSPLKAYLTLSSHVTRSYTRPPHTFNDVVEADDPEVTRTTTEFDMSAFRDYDTAFQALSHSLNFLSIPLHLHSAIVGLLLPHGRTAATWQRNVGRTWVPMEAEIQIAVFHRLGGGGDDVDSLERALAESEAAAGHGMVPAAEAAVKKMLKRVRVEVSGEVKKKRSRRSDDVAMSCPICMEDIPAGSTAAELPCSHVFHEKCVVRWLEESHYCPICRFELPTRSIDHC